MAEITKDQLLILIKSHVKEKFKTQSAFAESLGVSSAYVSGVLLGKMAIPASWLGFVGATACFSCELPSEEGTYTFELSDCGFVGMPLDRVAKYMSELAKLVGKSAVFAGMTANEIKFREAG